MNPAIFIAMFLPIIIFFITQHNYEKLQMGKIIRRKQRKNTEEISEMKELAARFLGKECIIYTFNSQIVGVIKEISETAVLVDRKGCQEAVNLDFVVRVREYPKTKNGKKKSVVLD